MDYENLCVSCSTLEGTFRDNRYPEETNITGWIMCDGCVIDKLKEYDYDLWLHPLTGEFIPD